MAVTIKNTNPHLQNTEMHETRIKCYRQMNYVSLNILFGGSLSPMTSFENKPPFLQTILIINRKLSHFMF